MTNDFRVAVVGAGMMGADHVGRIATTIAGATVSAVVEPDEARRTAALGLAPGAAGFADLDAALASGVVDAVLVATPGRLVDLLDRGALTLDAVEVAASLELDGFGWQILHVTHGDVTDSYQVLVATGAERDALATEEGATAYVRGAAELGEVHGAEGGDAVARMLGPAQQRDERQAPGGAADAEEQEVHPASGR